MQNTENFFILCFVCSQLGAGHGETSPWLGSNVMSPWGIRCCTKVSFKNILSFSRFYIFLIFYIHYKWPLQEIKVWVFTALACWQVVWKSGGQIIFRDQASYTVDNKTGSKGKVVCVHEMKARWGSRLIALLIHNLRARHIAWSCCSLSSHPHLGEINLWYPLNRRLDGPSVWICVRIQTLGHPALRLVTVQITVLPPYNKMQVQKFMGDGQM